LAKKGLASDFELPILGDPYKVKIIPISLNMRIISALILVAFIVGCSEQELSIPDKEFKSFSLSFSGVKISSGPLDGGRKSDVSDPTYLFIEIKRGNEFYATGVFKEIPTSLKLRLPDQTDFTINVKAIRKGSSHGIFYEKSGIYTTINWSVAQDSLNFQNPIQNGADAGLCYVYTQADSSSNAYQYYPPTDTYAAQLSINTGTIQDTLEIELKRKIFGIESRIRNFKKGRVRVLLAVENSSTDGEGISSQVINYPDTLLLNTFSLMVLQPPRPNLRLRVLYDNTESEEVIFDGWVEVEALEKKILDIDLGRFNADGRQMDIKLVDGQLSDGELIKIN
jgi:hypothetical protein